MLEKVMPGSQLHFVTLTRYFIGAETNFPRLWNGMKVYIILNKLVLTRSFNNLSYGNLDCLLLFNFLILSVNWIAYRLDLSPR